MTKAAQKKRERFFAEEAARRLGVTWDLGDDRERPDFVVTEGARQFGLEVTQLFVGPHGNAGSVLKVAETKTQRAINALQREYEFKESVTLTVQFVGNMEADNLATVISALRSKDLPSKEMGYHFVHETTVAHPVRARLRVHVTKGHRSSWYCINDRAGFVDCSPYGIIATAIAKKAADRPRYEDVAGNDVRLLLVADRISNSGKLMAENETKFDLHGFRKVYLFPYPENVIVLRERSAHLIE